MRLLGGYPIFIAYGTEHINPRARLFGCQGGVSLMRALTPSTGWIIQGSNYFTITIEAANFNLTDLIGTTYLIDVRIT